MKKVVKNTLEGRRCVGKPRQKWLEDVENDLKKMVGRSGRKTAEDGEGLILKEARVLHGP